MAIHYDNQLYLADGELGMLSETDTQFCVGKETASVLQPIYGDFSTLLIYFLTCRAQNRLDDLFAPFSSSDLRLSTYLQSLPYSAKPSTSPLLLSSTPNPIHTRSIPVHHTSSSPSLPHPNTKPKLPKKPEEKTKGKRINTPKSEEKSLQPFLQNSRSNDRCLSISWLPTISTT